MIAHCCPIERSAGAIRLIDGGSRKGTVNVGTCLCATACQVLGASSPGDGVSADHPSAPYEVFVPTLGHHFITQSGSFPAYHEASFAPHQCNDANFAMRHPPSLPPYSFHLQVSKLWGPTEAYKQKIEFPPHQTSSNECTAQVRTLSETPLELFIYFLPPFLSPSGG